MLELQKVFDEIKIGFFLWFYKHMCNQRARLHAATYDRVVLVVLIIQIFHLFIYQKQFIIEVCPTSFEVIYQLINF